MEEEVVRSGLDYVIARPPILKDDPSMGGATLMTLSVARSRGEHVKRHPRNQVRSKINFPDGRLTAPYFPELEPDVVLTHPHASGVEDLHTLW